MKYFPITQSDEDQLHLNAGTILGQTGLMQTVADTVGGDWGAAIAATAKRIHDANLSNAGILSAARDNAVAEPPVGDEPPIDTEPPFEPPATIPEKGAEFLEGGEYEWLADEVNPSDWPQWAYDQAQAQGLINAQGTIRVDSPAWRDLGPDRMQVSGGWNSDQFVDMVLDEGLPGAWLNMGTNHAWGDTCLWGTRVYNARGAHGKRTVMRCGDFERGKEGHVVYANAAADFELSHLIGIQHGAQLAQVVWRPGETLLPIEEWPDAKPDGLLHLHHLASIDGGVINKGMAVRASWPISIFTPGHKHVKVEHVYQRTAHDVPFHHSTKGACRSHGFLLCAKSGNGVDAQGELLEVSDVDVEVTDTDRSVMRFGSVNEVLLTDGRVAEIGKVGGIGCLASVRRLRIDPSFEWSGTINVFSHEKPYNSPIAVLHHQAGNPLDIDPSSYL